MVQGQAHKLAWTSETCSLDLIHVLSCHLLSGVILGSCHLKLARCGVGRSGKLKGEPGPEARIKSSLISFSSIDMSEFI